MQLNHNHFVALLIAIGAGLVALTGGGTDGLRVADVLILDVSRVGLLLGVFFGLLYFLRGTAYDVLREVFEEANGAAAILLAGLLVAMAIAFG